MTPSMSCRYPTLLHYRAFKVFATHKRVSGPRLKILGIIKSTSRASCEPIEFRYQESKTSQAILCARTRIRIPILVILVSFWVLGCKILRRPRESSSIRFPVATSDLCLRNTMSTPLPGSSYSERILSDV